MQGGKKKRGRGPPPYLLVRKISRQETEKEKRVWISRGGKCSYYLKKASPRLREEKVVLAKKKRRPLAKKAKGNKPPGKIMMGMELSHWAPGRKRTTHSLAACPPRVRTKQGEKGGGGKRKKESTRVAPRISAGKTFMRRILCGGKCKSRGGENRGETWKKGELGERKTVEMSLTAKAQNCRNILMR